MLDGDDMGVSEHMRRDKRHSVWKKELRGLFRI